MLWTQLILCLVSSFRSLTIILHIQCVSTSADEILFLRHIAAALWATIFSGLIIFALTFFVTLTIVSSNKEVRQVFDLFYPALLAILLYLCMVAILLRIFRKNMYRGFMRQRPALLNILNTFHEGWMANLSVLTIPLRFVTLLLVTFFYLGRIDTVFLAPGVGWIINKFPLDGLPIIFRRDLFLHEAVSSSPRILSVFSILL